MTAVLHSSGVEATLDLGRRLAACLRAGDVVLLEGPLGAGKTVLVRGIVEGLGGTGEVASPTFVLVRHHRGRLPVVHADLYRLEDPADAERLGLLELAEDGVLVVEWAERAPSLSVPGALRLRLRPGVAEEVREVEVEASPSHLRKALEEPGPVEPAPSPAP